MQIIRKLGLQGMLLEQLVMKPGVLRHPERYLDSPSLMRFAMDVRRALSTEGWESPEPITITGSSCPDSTTMVPFSESERNKNANSH